MYLCNKKIAKYNILILNKKEKQYRKEYLINLSLPLKSIKKGSDDIGNGK